MILMGWAVSSDLAKIDEVRGAIPVSTQRRTDLYRTEWIA